MIYLDSSAVLKVVFDETESAAFRSWYRDGDRSLSVSSALLRVEMHRACRRFDFGALPLVQQLLAGFSLLPVEAPVLALAADLDEPLLRSLDAIHLASALGIGSDLDAFVTYDRRLAAAATSAGLEVVSPGAAG